jgi:hypothetical protein
MKRRWKNNNRFSGWKASRCRTLISENAVWHEQENTPNKSASGALRTICRCPEAPQRCTIRSLFVLNVNYARKSKQIVKG